MIPASVVPIAPREFTFPRLVPVSRAIAPVLLTADPRSITLPVTPPIPATVATGDLITATHENTVTTSLADLWQNEQALAAAIFVDPTTTKGDLLARTGSALGRLGVGAAGSMLTADPTQATGLKWAAIDIVASGLQTPWLSDIDGASKFLKNAGGIGVGLAAPIQSATGRAYVSVRGSTDCGTLELAQGTASPDGDGVAVGLIQFTDSNSIAADKRVCALLGAMDGAAANNRGGAFKFLIKADGASGFSERARIAAKGFGVGTGLPGGFTTYSPGVAVIDARGSGVSAGAVGVVAIGTNFATATSGDILGALDYYHPANGPDGIGGRIWSSLEGAGGANGFGANLRFWTKADNGVGTTERVRITAGGTVIVGAQSVVGQAKIAVDLTSGGPLTTLTTSILLNAQYGAAAGGQGIDWSFNNSGFREVRLVATLNSGGSAAEMAFYTNVNVTNANGTEKMRITGSGGVKIFFLPSANPGAGSKELWYDPADGNRVKYAP